MILLRWLITTLAIFALPFFVAGITVQSILTAVIVAACLVFLNLIVKPVITLLTLPLNILTLGLFSIIINGLFFWLVAQIITGFTVTSFFAAIIGALVISVWNYLTLPPFELIFLHW
jgi:putative membrane protein